MFILLNTITVIAQTNQFERKFLRIFNQQSFAGKVHTFDTLNGELKLKYYPLVKDDLLVIKQKAIIDNKTDILNKLQKIEGEIFFQEGNYSKCIEIYTDLLNNGKIKNYIDSSIVLHRLKNSYVKMNALDKAIGMHHLLQKIKNKHSEINYWLLYPNLSVIYYNMGLYKEALNQQVTEVNDLKNDKNLLLSYYNNRGLFWNKYGNIDSAISNYELAKKMFYDIHKNKKLVLADEFTIGLIEGNIGQAYVKKKEYTKAIPLLEKDIESSIKANELENAASSEIDLAKCYLNLSLYKNSKTLLDNAAKKIKINSKTYLALLKQYAIYYEKTGNQTLSIASYSKYISLKDSIDKEENLKTLISSQVAYNLSEKENELIENKLKISEKNKQVEEQKSILLFLLISGIFFIVIIVFITIQLKKTNNRKKLLELKNKKIKTRNTIISKALVDKDLLVKEIHHRVKNNLQIVSSLLKLQASKTNNSEIQNSLNEAQDRLNSMSILHQLLYKNNQMNRLSFNKYLLSLIDKISESFASPNKKISIKTNVIELELDIDTATPLGLITNEILSNAYKHAFTKETGEINIILSKIVKDIYMLKISDNGIGLPADFNLKSIDSLGLDIVSILSEQINAELKIYNNNGANFEIIFTAN